jgi:hypothetical protein
MVETCWELVEILVSFLGFVFGFVFWEREEVKSSALWVKFEGVEVALL